MAKRKSKTRRAGAGPAAASSTSGAEPIGTSPTAVRLIEAHKAALCYFGAGGDVRTRRQSIGRFLMGALAAAISLPLLFYLRFGRVDEFAWAFTVFMVVLLLLTALGVYIADKPQYHSPVPLYGDRLDAIGAFWLLACACGPFIGWLMTSVPTVTVDNWRILYAARTLCAGVLPIVTALPLTRYARGNVTLMALALLIGVTALPVLSAGWTTLDLVDGADVRKIALVPAGQPSQNCITLDGGPLDIPCDALAWGHLGDTVELTYLRHSNRLLAVRRLTSTASTDNAMDKRMHVRLSAGPPYTLGYAPAPLEYPSDSRMHQRPWAPVRRT